MQSTITNNYFWQSSRYLLDYRNIKAVPQMHRRFLTMWLKHAARHKKSNINFK